MGKDAFAVCVQFTEIKMVEQTKKGRRLVSLIPFTRAKIVSFCKAVFSFACRPVTQSYRVCQFVHHSVITDIGQLTVAAYACIQLLIQPVQSMQAILRAQVDAHIPVALHVLTTSNTIALLLWHTFCSDSGVYNRTAMSDGNLFWIQI